MKDSEALEILREKYMDMEYYFAENDCYPEGYDAEYQEAIAEVVKKLSEYSKIGTVEECRAAVEKQREKKPMNIRLLETSGIHCGVCPICKNPVYADLRNLNHREYCGHCGQAIDWSDSP